MKAKNKKLESDIASKLKINQDMSDKLREIEKERDRRNAELSDLRTNQKNLKSDVEKQLK